MSSSPLRELPRAVTTHSLGGQLSSAVIRLLEVLKCPMDSRMLCRQIVREIIYRVLREEKDGALLAFANRNGNFMRIARVLKEVHADSAKPFTVESMSKRASMSIAAFHHNFKLVAGSSPLQYLKRIRLDRAKRLMIHAVSPKLALRMGALSVRRAKSSMTSRKVDEPRRRS